MRPIGKGSARRADQSASRRRTPVATKRPSARRLPWARRSGALRTLILALQRTAGNAAVSRMIVKGARPVLTRGLVMREPTRVAGSDPPRYKDERIPGATLIRIDERHGGVLYEVVHTDTEKRFIYRDRKYYDEWGKVEKKKPEKSERGTHAGAYELFVGSAAARRRRWRALTKPSRVGRGRHRRQSTSGIRSARAGARVPTLTKKDRDRDGQGARGRDGPKARRPRHAPGQ